MTLILVAILVAGCVTPVLDLDAAPTAGAQLQLASAQCNDLARRNSFDNLHDYVSCYLIADRQFATAIKLTKMEIFEAYRDRVLLLATAHNDGLLNSDEFYASWNVARNNYNVAVVGAHLHTEEQRQRQARALQVFGASLQQAGANINRAAPTYRCQRNTLGGLDCLPQ